MSNHVVCNSLYSWISRHTTVFFKRYCLLFYLQLGYFVSILAGLQIKEV